MRGKGRSLLEKEGFALDVNEPAFFFSCFVCLNYLNDFFMLCYVMLRYIILSYIMLCYVILYYGYILIFSFLLFSFFFFSFH
jgi:hypothetical protein